MSALLVRHSAMLILLFSCPPNHSPSSTRACLHNMSHICACYGLLLTRVCPSFFNLRLWGERSTLHLRESISQLCQS